LNAKEKETQSVRPFDISGADNVVRDNGKQVVYSRFDKVLEPHASQEVVYEAACAPLVRAVLDGYNAGLFAYGQSGGGKTYSLLGSSSAMEGESRGIIPRAISEFYQTSQSQSSINDDGSVEMVVALSFYEIYQNELYDLLRCDKNGNSAKLLGRENQYLKPNPAKPDGYLSEWVVSSEEQAIGILKDGSARRRYAAMPLNPESSRSHGIFLLKIVKTDPRTYQKTRSVLYFADLMGSEALVLKDDGSNTMEETTSINMDLLNLTRVIKALSDPKGVPAVYRDATLTYVLRDVLGGNSKTSVLITCSPHKIQYIPTSKVTLSLTLTLTPTLTQYFPTSKTLRFGDDCKGIRREVPISCSFQPPLHPNPTASQPYPHLFSTLTRPFLNSDPAWR